MYFLIYTSKATSALGEAEFDTMVSLSARANDSRGITGVLMRNDERLIQLLEGPERAVRPLVERIERDDRHTAFSILLEGPTERAALPHWSMQLASADRLHQGEVDPLQVYLRAVWARTPNVMHKQAIAHLLAFENIDPHSD